MKFLFCLAVTVLATATIAWAGIASKASEQPSASTEGTFPQLTATNLEGTTLSLPADFAGERNLLLIAFQREQQKNVDTWLHQMKRFESSPGFRYYELPTIDKLNPLVRWFFNSGMRRGIPDRDARARTFTLYIDKPPFRKALNIADEKQIYAILIDRSGRVLWRAEGDFDEAKGSSLQDTLARVKQ
jgi:hypothetical protein